jgi:8-oxo-dGTP pyrophosphatase MutT (NUDIX family)
MQLALRQARLGPWPHVMIPLHFDALASLLRDRLRHPLPGTTAHVIMAPRPRAGWQPAFTPPDARLAGALVLLYPHSEGGRTTIALTVRAAGLVRHSGQVSLPGGAVDDGETALEAALREADEEIGVSPQDVELVGALSPLHIPVSGFVLQPVVGIARERPVFRLAPHEVARVLEVPLDTLADSSVTHLRTRVHEGREYEVPYFAVEGEQVWGATAMVLGELLSVLGAPPAMPAASIPEAGASPESREEFDADPLQPREPRDREEAPGPCPRCGHAPRLFTPNARRRPYDPAGAYEPAWQCTACGDTEFLRKD